VIALTVLWGQSCQSNQSTGSTSANPGTSEITIEPPSGEVGPFKFQIDVANKRCVFKYQGPLHGQFETEVLAPCEFVRDASDKVTFYRFKNPKRNGGGDYQVILLIGGPPSKDHSDKYMKAGCGTEALPITLSPRGVALGHVARDFGYICPSSDVRDAMFGFGAVPR